jgi:hypothetical protein
LFSGRVCARGVVAGARGRETQLVGSERLTLARASGSWRWFHAKRAGACGGEGGGDISMMLLAACIITRWSVGVMVGDRGGWRWAFEATAEGTGGRCRRPFIGIVTLQD